MICDALHVISIPNTGVYLLNSILFHILVSDGTLLLEGTPFLFCRTCLY